MSTTRQVHSSTTRKVAGATVGAGGGAVVSQAVLWAVDAGFFNGDAPPGVPDQLAGLVLFAVPVAGAWLAGYFTRPSTDDQVNTGGAHRADGPPALEL